jgi:translation initiation factor IF-1
MGKFYKGKKNNIDYDLDDPNILQVSVIKALGNSRFYVNTKEGKQMLCTIPNRFSGKNKSHNLVVVGQIILVSLYDFLTDKTKCEYLQILQNSTPPNFLNNIYNPDEDIVFTEKTEPEPKPVIETVKNETFDMNDFDFI